ncbi:MAG TPA: hypothetical protein PK458_00810 [Phycisphaerae bacterium]|nr:hypothetical protein [Phycisphaerae bacterium]HOJ73171.1 hypothetical protein [Phycisphaerae bacterium]HOM52176.1 hypothetical protein [Phycisphaerae bacterium]HON67003.1 hypothetical protein [Phycisphaerae bacterium]HPP25391.1 hypothetical protein [Phycisphaerae bacterium]
MIAKRSWEACGAALVISALAALMTGCPPVDQVAGDTPPLPGSGTIVGLEATGAVVGGTGLLRVTLGDPVDTTTTVLLSSSNPAVAAVPASVTIVDGSANAQTQISGVSPGNAVITATLDGSTLQRVVTVVSSLRVQSVSTLEPALQTGLASTVTVQLNIPAPAETTVTLVAEPAGVIDVPPSVVFPAFAASQSVPVLAAAPGTAALTASLNNSSEVALLSVVETPQLARFTLIDGQGDTLLTGIPSGLAVMLNAAPTSNVTVHLTSSDPAVITVPGNVLLPAGTSSTTAVATPVAPGTATLTATLNGTSAAIQVRVVDAPTLLRLEFPDRVQVGTTSVLTVLLDVNAAEDTTVTLASSDPSVIAVPTSLIIPAGSSQAGIAVTALETGSTVITADLNGDSLGIDVEVVATNTVVQLEGPGVPLQAGATSTLSLRLAAAASEPTIVEFANSDPSIASVPEFIELLAGERDASVPVQGLAAGSTTITATTPDSSASVVLDVVDALAIANVSGGPVIVGQSAEIRVSLDAIPAVDTVVNLATDQPSILQVPAQTVIPAGDSLGRFTVLGLSPSPPIAVITATLGPSVGTTTVTVLPSATQPSPDETPAEELLPPPDDTTSE